jgi:hypothetical protein
MRRTGSFVVPLFFVAALASRPAAGAVITLLSQERRVEASATLQQPPDPDDTVTSVENSVGFGTFEKTVQANRGSGPNEGPLASATATQTSSALGTEVHAEGTASATSACSPTACGSARALSEYSIRFQVYEAQTVRLTGRVQTDAGAPELAVILSGPGVSLVSTGNGGSEDIDLEALLTPGEYLLQARTAANGGDSGSFLLNATFTSELVGVAPMTWTGIKRLYRN